MSRSVLTQSAARYAAKYAAMLWLVCALITGTALQAATPSAQKKKKTTPASASSTKKKSAATAKKASSKKSSRKTSAKTSRKKRSSKSAPSYEKFVPVPEARPLPQQTQPEPAEETAVPTPDMDAEQRVQSFSKASPEAASALSVQDRLARGNSALRYATALRGFFQALQLHGGPQGTSTVRVLQFGDSHTAADMFSGELRSQMQSKFGDGGVGFTYAGHPFAGYRILGSGRGQSTGWATMGTHFTQLGDALLGMGGVAIEAQGAGDFASISVNCKTLDVHYLRRAGGGSFSVIDNGQTVDTVSTNIASETPAPSQDGHDPGAAGNTTITCQPGRNDVTLTTKGDGPVRLLGTVSLQPGITWEAIGINGAEAPLIMRWNRSLFDTYLAAREPQLIVLAYGTNEAAARWTREDYQQTFATLIDHLHTVAPDASILVLGPGDRSIARSSYVAGRRGRRTRRTSYTPYTGTDRILSAQREVCRTHNCAFWDWSARMGGFGSMQRWVSAAYAQPDHTHLTGTGYRALADALFADLMSSYDGYLKRGY